MYDNDADVYATIDADLQDDPECIVEMMQKINGGCDIVYGVRKKKRHRHFFQAFYGAIILPPDVASGRTGHIQSCRFQNDDSQSRQ